MAYNEYSRTQNSILVIVSGVFQKIVNIAIGFISRKIYILYLGMAYVGINALFSNVLSLLSLAELGIGSAITVYLYRPLAEKDTFELAKYMQFYKKCYFFVGLSILSIGLSILPFLPQIVKFNEGETPDVNLYLVYILFLANSVASYWFFAYKSSVITADQKGYIVQNYNTAFSTVASVLKCVVVICFGRYILALIAELTIGIVKNILIARKVDELYPFIGMKNVSPMDKAVLKKIFGDVKALFISNVSFKLFSATDNLIISGILGTVLVGYSDNYAMIINYVVMIIAMLTASLSSSIGNLNATESLEYRLSVFEELDFANYWLSCVSFSCLLGLLTPFIQLFFGVDKSIPFAAVVCLCLHFYMGTANNILNVFKISMGVIRQGCYLALFGGALNIVITLILAPLWGLFGVFVSTIISECFTTFFPLGFYTFKYGFKVPYQRYVLLMFKRLGLAVIIGFVVCLSCNHYSDITFFSFFIRLVICGLIPNAALLMIYGKTEVFKRLISRAQRLVTH